MMGKPDITMEDGRAIGAGLDEDEIIALVGLINESAKHPSYEKESGADCGLALIAIGHMDDIEEIKQLARVTVRICNDRLLDEARAVARARKKLN